MTGRRVVRSVAILDIIQPKFSRSRLDTTQPAVLPSVLSLHTIVRVGETLSLSLPSRRNSPV